MIMENHQITIREVADDVGYLLVHAKQVFFYVLGTRHVTEKFDPYLSKLLNFYQKHCQMDIALEFLNEVSDNPELLKWVITGHETWEYLYDIETKSHSSQ